MHENGEPTLAQRLSRNQNHKENRSSQRKVLQRSDLTTGSAIGTGAYGTVYKVQFKEYEMEKRCDRDVLKPRVYALKEMLVQRFLQEGRVREVFIERCVLSSLNHPTIIKFYQSFKNGNKLYLLVEYCQGGSLSDFLTRQKVLTTDLARHITAEIVLALEYLRQKQVVHRDLKPGNIVLDRNYHIKLIDFATCKVFNKEISEEIKALRSRFNLGKSAGLGDDTDIQDNRSFSLVGTEEYIAPETLTDSDLSYASDYWSLGIILYQLLNGVTPFKGHNDLETFQNIRNFTEIKYEKANCDPIAKDLIERLLKKEPAERIGAADIEELKSHPFFKDIDWATLRETKPPYNPPQRFRRQQQNLSKLNTRPK